MNKHKVVNTTFPLINNKLIVPLITIILGRLIEARHLRQPELVKDRTLVEIDKEH